MGRLEAEQTRKTELASQNLGYGTSVLEHEEVQDFPETLYSAVPCSKADRLFQQR